MLLADHAQRSLPSALTPGTFRSLAAELSSPSGTSPLNFLGLLARLVSAGVFSTWCMVAADACVRSGWRYFSVSHHVLGALGLFAMVGALLGLLAACLIWVEWRVLGRRLLANETRALRVRALFYGAVGALASMSTAIYTFSGEHVGRTLLRSIGPLLFMLAAGSATAVGAGALLIALRLLSSKRWLLFGLVVALLAASGALVVWIDLTQYVSLYSRIHTILELSAALCLGAAFALGLHALTSCRVRAEAIVRGLGALGLCWLLAFVALPKIRLRIDDWLRHVWLEEAYVGRVLRREQVAEEFLKAPLHWPGLYMSRVARVRERFPLGAPSVGSEWLERPAEEPSFAAQIAALRGPKRGYNVIVYYVDTLRSDVAKDPQVMPNLARFAETSLDFQHAYAAGSDTLRSLPALTGGNYDVSDTPDHDLLRVAAQAGYDRQLVIAKSAREFIGKLRPEFHFDRTTDVEDYPKEMQVWGYGAQQSTARPVVDRAIEFFGHASAHRQAFFSVAVQLRSTQLARARHALCRALGSITPDCDRKQRSKLALPGDRSRDRRGVRTPAEGAREAKADGQYRRAVRVRSRRSARPRWLLVHSVFLWDQLIRVPLLIHAPALGSHRIDERVSLIDVAPTVARFMLQDPNMGGYQGEDLLGYLVPNRPPRRLPLLLTAAAKDVLVRVGVVDPVRDWKLVLSFEAALPELYKLDSPDPDSANLAEAHPKRTLELLRQIYHSPIFPRSSDDFDVRETKTQRAQSEAEAAEGGKH